MVKRAAAVTLVCLIAACERRAQVEAPTCDINTTLITDSSIGPLYVGEAVGALRTRCPAVLDTTLPIRLTDRAPSARALRLEVVGTPVVVRYDGERVTSLLVETPAFRTSDSVGVGTSIAKFRNAPGVRVVRTAPQAEVVLRDRARCGMEFYLSGAGTPPPPAEMDPPLTGSSLGTWPDAIVVNAVRISECRGNVGDVRVDSVSEFLTDSLRADSIVVQEPIPVAALTPSATPIPTLPPAVTPVRPAPVPAPRARPARGDTTSIIANALELAELRSAIAIPVQGVARTQLRDTYTESRGTRAHDAIEILAPRGTPVLSATDGKLLKLFSSKAGGLMVYASDPSDRFIFMYGHLDRYADGLKEGMSLKRGQALGYVGTTGNAPPNTPHLHFAIARGRPSVAWWRGTPVNPYPLLAR
jgi:hypothetical protein